MSISRVDAINESRSIILQSVSRLEYVLTTLGHLVEDIAEKYYGRWDQKHSDWVTRETGDFLGKRQSSTSLREKIRKLQKLDSEHDVFDAVYFANMAQRPFTFMGQAHRNWSEAAIGPTSSCGVIPAAIDIFEPILEWFQNDADFWRFDHQGELRKILEEFDSIDLAFFDEWRLLIEREFDLAVHIEWEREVELEFDEQAPDGTPVTYEGTDAQCNYLDVTLDWENRTIRRLGHDAKVDLRNAPLLWETFLTFYRVAAGEATLEAWKEAYSGEWSARFMSVSRLKTEISALGLTIPNRRRQIVDDGT